MTDGFRPAFLGHDYQHSNINDNPTSLLKED